MESSQTQLTAEQLHAIYAPVWEKVPDARPATLIRNIETEHGDYATLDMWPFEYASRHRGFEEENAALCRVAVEDWLRTHAEGEQMRVYSDTFFTHPTIGIQDSKAEWVAYGKNGDTIHHALVAAALAVAEGKK